MVKIFDKRFFLYVLENIVNFKNIFSSIGIHFSWYSIYFNPNWAGGPWCYFFFW